MEIRLNRGESCLGPGLGLSDRTGLVRVKVSSESGRERVPSESGREQVSSESEMMIRGGD